MDSRDEQKLVTPNDEFNYNYSLFYNFKKLNKDEIASSLQYEVNYVGPTLCENIARENEFFKACVERTCSQILLDFDDELAFDLKHHVDLHPPSYKYISHESINDYLMMLRSNFIFDIGFKVRNEHKLIDLSDNQGLRLCRCPCSMNNWMRRAVHTRTIVNESDECDSDITWYSPVELMLHLESTYDNDTSSANDKPWLHKITARFLKFYYRDFFPNPWNDNRPLGTHFIDVCSSGEQKHLKKRFKNALKLYNEFNFKFNFNKIDINFSKELKQMVDSQYFPNVSNTRPQVLVKSVTYNNVLKKATNVAQISTSSQTGIISKKRKYYRVLKDSVDKGAERSSISSSNSVFNKKKKNMSTKYPQPTYSQYSRTSITQEDSSSIMSSLTNTSSSRHRVHPDRLNKHNELCSSTSVTKTGNAVLSENLVVFRKKTKAAKEKIELNVDINECPRKKCGSKKWSGQYEVIDASDIDQCDIRREKKKTQPIINFLLESDNGITEDIVQSRAIINVVSGNDDIVKYTGTIVRPLYANPDKKMDAKKIKWRLNFALPGNEFKFHLIVSHKLLMCVLRDMETQSFTMLDNIIPRLKKNRKGNNSKSINKYSDISIKVDINKSSPPRSISIPGDISVYNNDTCLNNIITTKIHKDSRRVQGSDFLFYTNDKHKLCKTTIKNKRIYLDDFKLSYKSSQFAFVPNWNLRTTNKKDCIGMITIIESDSSLYLGILLRLKGKYGHYLVFKGNFNELAMYTDRASILNDWYPKKFEYKTSKGFYVNQVYGTRLNEYFDATTHGKTNHENYFTSKIDGPDIISIDMNLVKTIFDSYKVYNVIYCIDNKSERVDTKKNDQQLVAVPLEEKEIGETGYKIGTFVYVPFDCLTTVSSTMSKGEFFVHVIKNKQGDTFRRLVPNNSKPTRIKIVTKAVFEALSKTRTTIRVDNFVFLVGTEMGTIEEPNNSGTTLSIIKNNIHNIEASNIEVTFNTIKDIHHVYGMGTSRKRCNHKGFCTYRGYRNTSRSHPGPFVDDDNIKNHQYFQQTEQTDNLSQLFMENYIHKLGKVAVQFLEREYSVLNTVINNCCNKSIITSGCPATFEKKEIYSNGTKLKKNKKKNWLGFSCSKHIDTCDSISGNKQLSKIYSDRCKSEYMKNLYDTIGPGMPTTCIYLHIWWDEADITKYRVRSYFIYDGLGIAQHLFDGCGITFLGYSFTHETSLCYLEKIGGEIVVLKNEPDIFSMFAWGKSGGMPDARRGM